MTAAQWQRVRDLFDRALEAEPGDPLVWARQQTGDAEVTDELLSLLAHHSRAGLFLSAPLAERVADLLEAAPRLTDGATLGPYTIVRELGRGGMGHVYLARDARLGRTVALKALPSAVTADERQRERLRREARAAAVLTHPGICTVYALEEIDGDLFIASEYVDGRSLREVIASGFRPSARELEQVTRELTQALASAHERGITHRDLKPENVMQTHDGRLKILDFGLALVRNEDAWSRADRMTNPGALIGTPGYMAPEQLRGEEADPRSDLFSLAIVLTEYATGVHPFDAATPIAMAARVLESQSPALSQVRADIPLDLAVAIDRCLKKVPAQRPADAGALLRLLDDRPGEVAGADPVTAWWRRHQVVMIVLYIAGSVLAWQIKEWTGGVPRALFLLVGVIATVAGVFRGHLLFAEQVNRQSFAAERRRAAPVTLVTDLALALALGIDGLLIAGEREVAGLLTLALAIGVVLARTVVERATTRGAFGDAAWS